MSFDRLVEQKIQEAMREGEFDNLEGEGQPINLDLYFATPPELRAGYSVLKNAGVLPEEMQLLKEANEMRQELEACQDEAARRELKRRISGTLLKYNLLRERYGQPLRSG